MRINVNRGDLAAVKAMLGGIKGAVPRVLMRSINKTLPGVRTDAATEVGKEITPKKKVIRDSIGITKARAAQLVGVVQSTGRPLGLIHYQARQTQKGVSFRVFRGQAKTLLQHGFVEQMSTGHEGVFIRKSRKTAEATRKARAGIAWKRLPRRYRLPIEERFGPAVPDIWAKDATMRTVLQKAEVRLSDNIEHEMEFELSKL